ncbi:MAG: cytosolic protein [Neobacillus sp.]
MEDKETKEYFDLSNVEKQKNYLTAEDYPEGPYGSPIGKNTPVENKSTPWKEGQRFFSNFNYENKSLHEGLPRQMEGSHPPHDDPDTHKQPPYNA